MKVAVFLTWDYSLKTWQDSGTLSRELKIFNLLNSQKNINIKLFTYGNSEDLKLQNFHNNLTVIPIYKNNKYFKNRVLRFLYSFLFPIKLKKYLDDIDIIFQHQLLGSWVPILFKKIYKIPLIIRTGYDMHEFAIKEKKQPLIKWLYRNLTHFAVKNSDIFTVASETDYSKFIEKFSLQKTKFVIRPNWVELQKNYTKLNDRYENRVLSVGRLVDQKNFDFLISEIAEVDKNIVIDIVGSGDKQNSLFKTAQYLNIDVNFLGNLNHQSLLNLYPKYKYFVSTSIFEGNPKTILEAMSSGCIVLASNIQNHKELISHESDGLLFDLKTGDLKKLICRLYSNEINIENISVNSIKKITKDNSLEKLVDDTYDDLKKLKQVYS